MQINDGHPNLPAAPALPVPPAPRPARLPIEAPPANREYLAAVLDDVATLRRLPQT